MTSDKGVELYNLWRRDGFKSFSLFCYNYEPKGELFADYAMLQVVVFNFELRFYY